MRTLALAALVAAPLVASAQDPATPPRIGFVDLKMVFERYAKKAQLEAELNAQYDQRITALSAERDAIATLEKEIQGLDLKTPYGQNRLKDFATRRARHEFLVRWEEQEFTSKVARMTTDIYVDILAAVGTYGRDHAYDAIFQVDNTPFEAQGLNALKLEMRTRTVLYRKDALDLTERIITLLNASAPPPK